MVTTFYNQKPSVNAAYRQLALDKNNKGAWQVRLIAGEKAGPEHAKVLVAVPVKTFDEGITEFNELFRELLTEGWKAYSPYYWFRNPQPRNPRKRNR